MQANLDYSDKMQHYMDMIELSRHNSIVSLSKEEFFEDPALPLQVWFRDPQPPFPRHTHAFDELVVILSGTARHVVAGQEFPVRSGDVFVVSGNQEHEYLDMDNLVLANVLFDGVMLGVNRWDIRSLPGFHVLFTLEPAFRAQHRFQSRLQLSERQLRRARELVEMLAEELSDKQPGYRMAAQGLFMQLVVYLSRCYSADAGTQSLDLLRIGQAIAHVETLYKEKITLDDLARMAYMSKRHFQRVFRECMGQAPIEYLMAVRARKAAELLRRTERTITRIAFDCGFSDSNYFIRCFRKVMGQTPRQYRLERG